MDTLADVKIIDLLNTLLEAERAGAKVLAAFLDEYPRGSAAWNQLLQVQQDEAKNCAILIDSIRKLGGVPSGSIGGFFGKALAVVGRPERLIFLNRGQAWVARTIAEALPAISDTPLREMLQEMYASHVANIDACDALLVGLDDPGAAKV